MRNGSQRLRIRFTWFRLPRSRQNASTSGPHVILKVGIDLTTRALAMGGGSAGCRHHARDRSSPKNRDRIGDPVVLNREQSPGQRVVRDRNPIAESLTQGNDRERNVLVEHEQSSFGSPTWICRQSSEEFVRAPVHFRQRRQRGIQFGAPLGIRLNAVRSPTSPTVGNAVQHADRVLEESGHRITRRRRASMRGYDRAG